MSALEEARATTNRVARTFALACRMLPRDVRDDVYLLYLVFRTLDDLVDEGNPEAAARVGAVSLWAVGADGAQTPEVEVLTELARRHDLPRDALLDFCLGMGEDLEGAVFETETDVDRYCYRVAGTVGVVMAAVLGTDRPERARPAAAALGMAMQRTNILRDIDEDAANGRVYIARETLERYGDSLVPGRREPLLRDQIARADALYEHGLAGIPELRRGRRAIAAAAGMYRELLRKLEQEGYGARAGRAVVPRSRKLAIVARAAWRA
jgi:phytoene synthase